tara:strand:- start:181 stop:612 length:432 start_codon:yes stop_codon:yes gene_type:complete
MTDVKEGVIDRVKDYNNWLRVFFMLVYGLVLLYAVVPVTFVVMVAQLLFMFSLGTLNSNLTAFGESLVEYIKEVLGFLFFKTDEKPFPFKSYPNFSFSINENNDIDDKGVEASPKRKKTVKKKQTKKVAKAKAAEKKISRKKN